MNQHPEQIREEIRAAFEASRESPGDPYDEDEIVWHLVANPEGSGSIHNSFKGKRRLVRFLRGIEAKFSVCFSMKDWESLKSLDQIQERLVYLLDTPKSSLASIRHILAGRPPVMLAVVVLFLSIPFTAILVKLFGVGALAVLIVPTLVIAKLFQMDRSTKKFYRALEATIRANSELQSDVEHPVGGRRG